MCKTTNGVVCSNSTEKRVASLYYEVALVHICLESFAIDYLGLNMD